jgi:hypothetical protein
MDFGWRDGFQLWRVAANILNKQPRRSNKECPPAVVLGVGFTTFHRKYNIEDFYQVT